MAPKTATKKKRTESAESWTDEEKAAMKDHVAEMKTAKRRGNADAEPDVLAKIAAMPDDDRALAERFHAIVKANAPMLTSRLYYGMPAYAKDGKVLCFFQPASKFKARYATIGFDDVANLDEGNLWPTSFAVAKLTAADEKRIADLVKRAVS
jgi:uncharacterized protein YdhG (YjbR/CyaY superfamily)